jgi:MoxR-like ATPase
MSTENNDVRAVEEFGAKYRQLKAEIAKVVIGQDQVVEKVLIAIFSRGHCLLVGVPGLAKTLLVNTVAHALGSVVQPDPVHP